MIGAARPRSFVSPILLGIAVYVHRTVESKELITILNKLGSADHYTEVKRSYAAFMAGEGPPYDLEAFCQFIYDHAIACVTPAKEPQRQLIP